MLSTFNLPSNNIDPNRQMAMMRTYLSQLKDELESELYNIGWNNLSKELRDKINSLEGYATDNDQKFEQIRANMVTTEYLSANYATITSLNAVSADIGDLAAIAITTNNLSAQTINGSQITGLTINANQITAGTISADRISSAIMRTSAFTAANVSALYSASAQAVIDWVRINTLVLEDEGANRVFAPMTVDGHRVLGWR